MDVRLVRGIPVTGDQITDIVLNDESELTKNWNDSMALRILH